MRNGRLSKREIEQLWKAQTLLNSWIDYQEEKEPSKAWNSDDDMAFTGACNAACALVDFLSGVSDYGER